MKKSKTIVFVQNIEYPQQGAVDMFYYSKYLSKYKDYKVKVICNKINEDILHNNLEIIELGKINYFKFIFKSFFEIRKLNKNKNIEYVYFFAQHPFSIILQFFIKYLLNIKTIYDVVSGPIGIGLISFISKKTIQLGVCLSDKYVVLDKGLIKKLNLSKQKKHEIVGMGFDENIFYERKGINIFNKNDNEIIFSYIGTLHNTRKLHIFIKAFIKNIENNKNIKLYFIGSGNEEKKLKYISGQYLNKNIFFLGIKEHIKIPDYINSSDILVSYVPKIDYYEYQIPTKLIEYLACNKPVITTNTISQKEILKGYTFLLHKDDIVSTQNKIKYFIENYNKVKDINYGNIVKDYSWDKLVINKLLKLFNF